jgi:hypothetical protein
MATRCLDKARKSNNASGRITQNDQIGLLEPGWHMKFVTSLLAAAFLLAGVGTSHAAVRIADDRGGLIRAYVTKFDRLRSSGDPRSLTVSVPRHAPSFWVLSLTTKSA